MELTQDPAQLEISAYAMRTSNEFGIEAREENYRSDYD